MVARYKKKYGQEFKANGQTLFLDVYLVDDSVSKPVIARFNERMWDDVGRHVADLTDDEDWLLLRGRWLKQFNMLMVTRARCLTRPELLK